MDQFSIKDLFVRTQVMNGNDMQRIDADGKSVLIDDNNRFGAERNEIAMRHFIARAIRKRYGKRTEPILQALSNFLNHKKTYVDSQSGANGKHSVRLPWQELRCKAAKPPSQTSA